MATDDDLVERLRSSAEYFFNAELENRGRLLDQAADELVAVREELERLRVENTRLRAAIVDMARFLNPAGAEIVALDTCNVIAECVRAATGDDEP